MTFAVNGRVYPRQPSLDIRTHLFLCAIKNAANGFPHSQALALVGPPGTGKTTLAQEISRDMGASVHMLHGSTLGGPYEGMASDVLAEAYLTAAYDESGFISVLVIDDIETGDANADQKIAGTSSRHLVIGMLMALANNPFELIRGVAGRSMKKSSPKRAPALIYTSNALDVLSETMLRAGRCWMSTVDPHGEELQAIVAAMYSQCSQSQIASLVSAFPEETPAFFAEIGNVVTRARAEHIVQTWKGPFGELDFAALGAEFSSAKGHAGFEQLMEAAEKLASVDRAQSFLKTAA